VLERVSGIARVLASRGLSETLSVVRKVATHHKSGSTPAASFGKRRGVGLKEDKEILSSLDTFCSLLSSKGGISNFELMASGVVASLLEFLTASELGELIKIKEHILDFDMNLLSEPEFRVALESEVSIGISLGSRIFIL